MKSFNSQLIERIHATRSHLCVGLDISPEALRESHLTLKSLKKHTQRVIDATHDLVAAYKPNLAFFERWGSAGFQWLEETIDYIGEQPILIGDAKRSDIGNTARQYVFSLFDHFGFDAVTVNPYLGRDSIKPFLSQPERGVFILCRTSNPSAGDLQNKRIDSGFLYEEVARMALQLNGNDNIGLVVGATAPAEIKHIRSITPGLPFLIPGIGAQGGDLEKSMNYGNTDGTALINVSRGICYAGNMSMKAIRASAVDFVERMRYFTGDKTDMA